MYYLEDKNEPHLSPVLLRYPKDEKGARDKTKGLLMIDLFGVSQKRPFEIAGIAVKFSRLKTDKEILEFANKYGLLGVGLKQKRNLANEKYEKMALTDFEYENKHMESLDIWRWHIDYVKRLIRLCNSLNDEGDVDNLLRQKVYQSPYSDEQWAKLESLTKQEAIAMGKPYEPRQKPEHEIFWWDGVPALFDFTGDMELEMAGKVLLYDTILTMVKSGSMIDYSSVQPNKNAILGFSFEDKKATPYLLTVIYYDLWKTFNAKEPVKICGVCGRPFRPNRTDHVFCVDACRQKNARRAKKVH